MKPIKCRCVCCYSHVATATTKCSECGVPLCRECAAPWISPEASGDFCAECGGFLCIPAVRENTAVKALPQPVLQ